MGTRVRRAIGVLGALAAIAATTPSCSLLVDTNADQCAVSADCASLANTVCANRVCAQVACKSATDCAGFDGTTCSGSFCVPVKGCATNAQCMGASATTVCRKVAGQGMCVELLSADCQTLHGDYLDDNAILFGAILPITGNDATTGKSNFNAITLAIDELKQQSNGLPPAPSGMGNRPLAVLGCSDQSDAMIAIRAAKHLAEDVHVPAIVGAAFSGVTIKVATTVTIPDGVLLFSPSATSVSITDLQDNGLVWRTSPSDVYQAQTVALLVEQLEQKVRGALNLMPGDKIKLAVLHKGDAYGNGLGKAVEKLLTINNAPVLDPANAGLYARTDYGDPDDPKTDPLQYAKTVSDTIASAPHIVLDFGTNESITQIMEPIEKGWTESKYRPRWVFADGGLINELWAFVGKNAELRGRIRGTVPGTTNANFLAFKGSYDGKYKDGTDPNVFGCAGAYDIAYLLAYSTVALGDQPITGANLVQGFSHLVPPAKTTITAGSDPNVAFSVLKSQGRFDFDGASGPLDFDLMTGEAPSDIQIWCLPIDAGGNAIAGQGSGLYFDAKQQKLVGMESSSICK